MKKEIFTVCVDNYKPDLCAITVPTIEAYAKKIGAKFTLITERKYPEYSPTYEKVQIHELGKNNDWNILIDADILIGEDFPDVTKNVPHDSVGLYMQYQADMLFASHPYFIKDGRKLGVASNFMVASKFCHDVWTPLVEKVNPSTVTKREFILDEYCFSRNVAQFGIKVCSIAKEDELNRMKHLNITTDNIQDPIEIAKNWLDDRTLIFSKKAVVTLAIGNFYTKMGKITHPTLKAYADKIGADFIVIDDMGERTLPHYRKLDLGKLLKTYGRILYVDTDILIREDAPDLFDIVPIGKCGMLDEGRFTDRQANMENFITQFGLDPKTWDKKYYNTGVMLFDKSHKALFIEPPSEINNFYEQSYINLEIFNFKIPMYGLTYKFNRMSCMDKITGEERYDSYFMHYAGLNLQISEEAQLKVMSDDLKVWKNSKPNYEFKKNIAILVEGGMGDQICAEPVIRYIRDNTYKNDNIIIISNWPELFTHLGLPSYKVGDKIENAGKYTILNTLRNPEHESWEWMSHPLIHGIDFAALQSIRMILPLENKQIQLPYNTVNALNLSTRLDTNLKDLILIHPGRGWDSKTFPSDVWQSYIDTIIDSGFKVAVIGKRISKEQGIVEVDTSRCIDLVDKLTVEELITLIANANILISNDSAPIHIAGAFDNWIGVIATCKHPEKILPYRHCSMFYKAKNLEIGKLYDEFNHQPTQIDGATIGDCTEERMRKMLPPPSDILKFIYEAIGGQKNILRRLHNANKIIITK